MPKLVKFACLTVLGLAIPVWGVLTTAQEIDGTGLIIPALLVVETVLLVGAGLLFHYVVSRKVPTGRRKTRGARRAFGAVGVLAGGASIYGFSLGYSAIVVWWGIGLVLLGVLTTWTADREHDGWILTLCLVLILSSIGAFLLAPILYFLAFLGALILLIRSEPCPGVDSPSTEEGNPAVLDARPE